MKPEGLMDCLRWSLKVPLGSWYIEATGILLMWVHATSSMGPPTESEDRYGIYRGWYVILQYYRARRALSQVRARRDSLSMSRTTRTENRIGGRGFFECGKSRDSRTVDKEGPCWNYAILPPQEQGYLTSTTFPWIAMKIRKTKTQGKIFRLTRTQTYGSRDEGPLLE